MTQVHTTNDLKSKNNQKNATYFLSFSKLSANSPSMFCNAQTLTAGSKQPQKTGVPLRSHNTIHDQSHSAMLTYNLQPISIFNSLSVNTFVWPGAWLTVGGRMGAQQWRGRGVAYMGHVVLNSGVAT